ncbi:MAG: extracellular solute-binding protein [Ruaniaceae bacterium]|nr:extracellular solute-binding protein [Ruaniaceae bacterium]
MRRMTTTILAAAAASALALAGCGGASDPAEDPTDGAATDDGAGPSGSSEVVVFTWWSAGSEAEGLEALVGVFNEQHPDFEFINGAVAGGAGSQAKQKLQADLDAGNPPDTFQAHAGAELTDYISAGQIEDVSALYDEFNLREVFPDTLMDQLTSDGKIYSIPSNIHRSNVAWASVAALEAAGLPTDSVPDSLDAWIADLHTLDEAGIVPITVGADWTQLHLLENVLLAELGADGYNGLWDGSTDWSGAEVGAALAKFSEIIDLAEVNATNDWEPAMAGILDGTVGYNVMGDWAVAMFNAADSVAGTDFLYAPVPGTEGVFNFLADSFTLPVGAPNPDGARAWLETISSVEGQQAFNSIKGSIPARTDVPTDEFGEYQQSAMTSFAEDTIVSSVAHGSAAPIAVSEAMKGAIVKFTQGASDVDQFQTELAAATGGN